MKCNSKINYHFEFSPLTFYIFLFVFYSHMLRVYECMFFSVIFLFAFLYIRMTPDLIVRALVTWAIYTQGQLLL